MARFADFTPAEIAVLHDALGIQLTDDAMSEADAALCERMRDEVKALDVAPNDTCEVP